jgi:hypothetical protein
MPSLVAALALLLLASGLCSASTASLVVDSKKELFLSAPSFAVVGASDDESKFGTIVRTPNFWLYVGMNIDLAS